MTSLRGKRGGLVVLCVLLLPGRSAGQSTSAYSGVTEVAVLAAEERGVVVARDLSLIRAGIHSRDARTARVAIRAVGRLERPDLITDLIPSLTHLLPEIRAEAANAIGQAAQGWTRKAAAPASSRSSLDLASAALIARLNVEADADVRAVIAETIGRLPYRSPDLVEKAERALLDVLTRTQTASDRLGVVQGLGALIRSRQGTVVLSAVALELLRALAMVSGSASSDGNNGSGQPAVADPARDVRVRRLAMEALIAARSVDGETLRRAALDPDAQMRRLALQATVEASVAATEAAATILTKGLADASPMVRLEALRAGRGRLSCSEVVLAARDPEPHVAIAAVDQLAACGSSDEAIALLEREAGDSMASDGGRRWHRRAHALVALASAAPSKASQAMPGASGSRSAPVRVYSARAATVMRDRAALERLAADEDDRVRRAAIEGLTEVAGHDADALYLAALGRQSYPVLRAAVKALVGTTAPEAEPALRDAMRRLSADGGRESVEVRRSMLRILRDLGVSAPADPLPRGANETAGLTVDALRRLGAARARVTVAALGSFDLALIANEAPLSVLRFERLARSGSYDGLAFWMEPNLAIEGPTNSRTSEAGDVSFTNDEVGRWPHVRGAIGFPPRDGSTEGSHIFIDLVDRPELDHEYTVFAHVLNGMDVIDSILEGDLIEKIEILDR